MAERPMYPTDADVREAWRVQHDLETSNAFPGLVQNYRPSSQTCDIVPLVQQQIPQADGTYLYESIPVIPSVAVLHPRARAGGLYLPIEDGDTVLCVVLDGDAGGWRRGANNSVVAPRDLARHHICNAVAVAGFYRFGEPFQSWNAASASGARGIVLGYDAPDGTRLLIKPDGTIEVTQGSGTVIRIAPDGSVSIGGVGLAALLDGVVTARGTDPFTGATYGVLGNASAVVMAKK